MYDQDARQLMKEHELDTEEFDAIYHEFYGYTKDYGTSAAVAILEKVCKDINAED